VKPAAQKQLIAAAMVPAQLPPPRVKLQGTVFGGPNRTVILASTVDGKARRLREGDEIDGWTVTRIERKQVTLKHQGQVVMVSFPAAQRPIR
jgi:type II secretory pathway component PulC